MANAVQLGIQSGHGLIHAPQGVGDDLVLVNPEEITGNKNAGCGQGQQKGKGIRKKITIKDLGTLSVHLGFLLFDGFAGGLIYRNTK